jgi:hypothetical protein
MPDTSDFEEVFEQLRGILKKFEAKLVVQVDKPGTYYLDTPYIAKNKRPISFGGVKTGKRYVSYHLMPVYGCAKGLEMSPELKVQMQGKACFNFKKRIEPKQVRELTQLTKRGFEAFQKLGWIGSFRARSESA